MEITISQAVKPSQGGFAMLDVLMALLLLAIALTGACATLVQTMRSTHAAVLAARAVDLADELTGELRIATSSEDARVRVAEWRTRVPGILPVGGLAPADFAELEHVLPPAAETPPSLALTLRWHGAASGALRELSFPIAAHFEGPLT